MGLGVVNLMSGDNQARRSTRLSNWMIGVGLAVVALAAYVLIALRVQQHGIN